MIEKPVFNLKAGGIIILSLYLGVPFLFLLYFVLVFIRPFEQHNLHPTYTELDRRGYYAYVVPPSMVEQYRWREETNLWSWRRHCTIDRSTAQNPLTINYFNEKDQLFFRISLSLWERWDWNRDGRTIAAPFDIPWAKAETLEMFEGKYPNGKVVYYLQYVDWHDTPVYVT